MHPHHYHHQTHTTRKVLLASLIATVAFVIIEVAAGVHASSLALLSDAGHNFTDALALLLAVFGVYLQGKPADDVKTFGYHRGGVLAAFLNALTLVVLSFYLFHESYERLLNPLPVNEFTLVIVAGLGLLLNGGILWGLHRGHKDDLNVRAVSIHMLGDALGSVGILIGAAAIYYTGWTQVDPILSIGIALLILWTAWDVIRESLNILLEGIPRGMNLRVVADRLQRVPGVLDVHDVHVWSLGSHAHALSCHALIEDMPTSESEDILQNMNRALASDFHIHHTTIQFEHVRCELSKGCSISGAHHHGDHH